MSRREHVPLAIAQQILLRYGAIARRYRCSAASGGPVALECATAIGKRWIRRGGPLGTRSWRSISQHPAPDAVVELTLCGSGASAEGVDECSKVATLRHGSPGNRRYGLARSGDRPLDRDH